MPKGYPEENARKALSLGPGWFPSPAAGNFANCKGEVPEHRCFRPDSGNTRRMPIAYNLQPHTTGGAKQPHTVGGAMLNLDRRREAATHNPSTDPNAATHGRRREAATHSRRREFEARFSKSSGRRALTTGTAASSWVSSPPDTRVCTLDHRETHEQLGLKGGEPRGLTPWIG